MKHLIAIILAIFTFLVISSQGVLFTKAGQKGLELTEAFNAECALQKECAQKIRDGNYDTDCLDRLESSSLKNINLQIEEAGKAVPWYLPVNGIQKQPRCELPMWQKFTAEN